MENSAGIKDQIIKNSFWNIVISFINRVGSFVLVVLLSKILMPEGFGRYSLAMTIAFFFITFSDWGINQTLIKYVSFGIDKKNNESALYLNYLFKIKLFITVALFFILISISYPLAFFIFNDSAMFPFLIILSFYVLFISLSSFFESLFFIKKNVKYISVKELLSFVFRLSVILLVGFLVISEFYKLIGIFLSLLIVSIFSFFFVFCFSKNSYFYLFKKVKGVINKKKILRFIVLLNIQNISLAILSQASIILLGIFLTKDYVGYYNAAWVLITGVSSLLFSFSYVLLPIFTKVDEQKFQNILKKSFRMLFILSIPISFGLSFLSKFFVVAVYGYEYLPASVPLSILAFIIPCIIGTDLALSSFSARDKQKKFSILMVISTFILFILSLTFIILFENPITIITGISIATLASWFFCLISSVFLLKKELNTNVISKWIIKILLSCTFMSLFIFFAIKVIGEMNIFKGIIITLFSAIIYFVSLLLMKEINKNELKELLGTLFKR